MNKKIFAIAILSILLLTISVVAITDNAGKKYAQAEAAFHKTYYAYSTSATTTTSTVFRTVLEQRVYVPNPAGVVASFSAESNTGPSNAVLIRILVDNIQMSPGTIYFDQKSDEDDWRAHSFNFGNTYLTMGWHTVSVQFASDRTGQSASLFRKSLITELENFL